MVYFLLGQYGIFLSEENLKQIRIPQKVSLKRYCEFLNTATVCDGIRKVRSKLFCQIDSGKCTSGRGCFAAVE